MSLLSAQRTFTYPEYLRLTADLLAQNLTTGANQSSEMIDYTRLNFQRMMRIEKTIVLKEELLDFLKQKDFALQWLVLTEAWCGDAAQIVPVLDTIAQASHGKIALSLILRDENLQIMDQFLTNGGRSIPKLICISPQTQAVIGSWGPRPLQAQALVNTHKQKKDFDFHELAFDLHKWYSQDKTFSTQQEILDCLRNWVV